MDSHPASTRTRRALFITGMERSGTTLLGAMLARHPGICRMTPPFVANLLWGWPDGVSTAEDLDRFLDDLYGRTRFKDSPLSRHGLRERLRPHLPLSFRDLAAEVVAAHSATVGKPDFVYWTDRTPWYVSILHRDKVTFDRILGDYRLVTIIRDGRAVLSSVLRAQTIRGLGFRTDLFHLAAQWRKAATLGSLFSDPGHYYQIRYEELVTRPVETLQGVCRFLDLPYDPGMLDYQDRHLAAPIHRLLAAAPSPERADAWQAEADGALLRIFDRLAREELRRSGYAPLPHWLQRRASAVVWESLSYRLGRLAQHRLRRMAERARAWRVSDRVRPRVDTDA
jgi:hypothetical protein